MSKLKLVTIINRCGMHHNFNAGSLHQISNLAYADASGHTEEAFVRDLCAASGSHADDFLASRRHGVVLLLARHYSTHTSHATRSSTFAALLHASWMRHRTPRARRSCWTETSRVHSRIRWPEPRLRTWQADLAGPSRWSMPRYEYIRSEVVVVCMGQHNAATSRMSDPSSHIMASCRVSRTLRLTLLYLFFGILLIAILLCI